MKRKLYFLVLCGILSTNSQAQFISGKKQSVASKAVTYCEGLKFNSVRPITKVILNDLVNESSPASTISHEMFLDKKANLKAGQTYELKLQGNTKGNFDDRFIVFADWNQDGVFSGEDEIMKVEQVINNSTGLDGKEAIYMLKVPTAALAGETRLRIKKKFGTTGGEDPCKGEIYGQAEDYILVVEPTAMCKPKLSCADGYRVNRVNFSGVEHVSECSDNGYGNYLEATKPVVRAGKYYPLEVTVGDSKEEQSVSVWIDYNNNGLFDASEFIYIGTTKNSTLRKNISIPQETKSGDYRMRIRTAAVGAEKATGDLACDETQLKGETEDYTIHINQFVPAVCDQGINSNNLENAVLLSLFRIAVDVVVQEDKDLKIQSVDFNHAGDGDEFTLKFYRSNARNGVGELIKTVPAKVSKKVLLGINHTFNYYTSTLVPAEPIVLTDDPTPGDTTYWMEIQTNAFAWETNNVSKFGQAAATMDIAKTDQWTVGEKVEYVYKIQGNCDMIWLSQNEIKNVKSTYYPNPVDNELNIQNAKNIETVRVFNMLGQELIRKIYTNQSDIKIDLSKLSKGNYIIRTESGAKTDAFKIIKK